MSFAVGPADTDNLVAEAVIALKSVILAGHSSTTNPAVLVARLARQLPSITNSRARASVFWLVGQYAADASSLVGWEGVHAWVPDVLRQGVKGFADEVSCIPLAWTHQ